VGWQKAVNVVAYLYKLLLHGKNVGGVNWPSQNSTIGGDSKGKPHDPSFPDKR
jgi:hypothetical protein